MTTIHRPNRPARVVLSPNAKHALTGAEDRDGDGTLYLVTLAMITEITDELLRLELITDNRPECEGHADDDHALLHGPYHCDGSCQQIDPQERFTLTDAGLRMRSYLQHQFYLRKLAEQVRAEHIGGDDLADLAAEIDRRIAALAEGDDTDIFADPITGVSIDFQLAFALAASLSVQSAEDLRQDLETYLGWND